MEMEPRTVTITGADEFAGSSTNINEILIKGKRTKRHRPLSPSAFATNTIITSSSSSASDQDEDAGSRLISAADYVSFSSTTVTYESTEEEEEEQDMANCLILLARGDAGASNAYKTEQRGTGSNISRIRFADMSTASATASSKIGFHIYECKTCNRTFPSFQALGGHRASHKKPKVSSPDDKKQPTSSPPSTLPRPNYDFQEAAREQPSTHIKTGPHRIPSLQFPSNIRSAFNKAPKIHECSICGSEFSSGQALGGHMRRHRASARTSTSYQVAAAMGPVEAASRHTSTAVNVQLNKPGNILELDLNLPAPEDDLRESKFQFTPTQKTMLLSAGPALVDCHY